jgi:tRNA nucleotidyltransferase (CCA-adding enzyme)
MAVTSSGHDIQSERAARRIVARFKVQTWNGYPIGRMVPLLIRTHLRAGELWSNRHEVTKKAFNRLAAEVDGEIELVVLLDAADRAGRRTRLARALDRQARWLFRKFEELRVNRETIKPLVMGRDLLALGVPPGPEMGRLLKRLYQVQLDNGFETKAAGMARARRLIERTSS